MQVGIILEQVCCILCCLYICPGYQMVFSGFDMMASVVALSHLFNFFGCFSAIFSSS